MTSVLQLVGGGAAIGSAAALLVLVDGHIAGISGIWGHGLRGDGGRFGWRFAFLAGLLLPAIWLIAFRHPATLVATPTLIVAGLLVGIGTHRAGGCTSGHGVCGNANFSLRSLVATLTFMVTAAITVFITRHVG